VTFYNIMINDLPTHSLQAKRATVRDTQYSAVTCFFFLRKLEAKSLELFWQDFIE